MMSLPRACPLWLTSSAVRQPSRLNVRATGTVTRPAAARRANLAEHVLARRGIFSQAAAGAKLRGRPEVGDRQNTARIAAGDPDEVGQHAADGRGVQNQVWRSSGDLDKTPPEHASSAS